MTDIASSFVNPRASRTGAPDKALEAVALEHTSECHVLIDADGIVRWTSPAVRAVLGYDGDEIDGYSLASIVHPEDSDRWHEAFHGLVQETGHRRRIQFRARHADGAWRWVEAVSTNMVDEPGVEGVFATLVDVSSRVTAKRRLARSERRLRSIVSSAGDVIAILDEQGRIDYITPTVATLLARSTSMVRQDIIAIVHPDDLAAMSELFAAALADPGTTQGPTDLRLLRGDGSWVTVEALFTDYRQDPIVRGVVLNARDVTMRRLAEREKQENQSILDALIEMAPIGIFLADSKGNWTYANARIAAELGVARDSLLGMGWTTLFDPETAERVRDIIEAWDEESPLVIEVSTRDEADPRELRATMSVPSFAGHKFGVVGTVEDVTNRRAADEMLVEGAALGSIAGVVGSAAHDLYNLLASIGMHVGLLEQEPAETFRLKAAEDAVDRAFNITEDLMAMSRPGRGRVAPVEVGAMLADLTEMLRVLVDHQADLVFEDRSGAQLAAADRSGLERVITNLVVNGRDAVAPRGTIRVEVEVVEVADDEVAEGGSAGRHVAVHVIDDGCGVPDDVKPRMFEPYFTTKDNGNGIGLAASRRNVRTWGGDIRFASTEGEGTTMTVLLPAV